MNYEQLFAESPYAFNSRYSILEEKDLGICADIASVRTPEYSVCSAEGLQGCPYTDTAFRMDLYPDGERIPTREWEWLPCAMRRRGSAPGFEAETLTAVIPGERGFVMRITLREACGSCAEIPIQLAYRGSPRYEESWTFNIPEPGKSRLEYYAQEGRLLTCTVGGAAFCITSSIENMRLFPTAYLWEGSITLPARGEVTFYVSVHMGERSRARAEAESALGCYESLIERSLEYYRREEARIAERLPHFSSSDKGLTALYYRSLVTYMLCRWENPDLCSVPYFSTGSINGGCMCSYLWDYCGGLMLHPLYDAEGNRRQILAYLKNDLTTSYALNPVTGGKVGPWYPVNQEKIICMVYYHVLFTGDRDFLFEQAGERNVLEWMLYHAYVGDDLSKPVELYDYGEGGNSHLELRREFIYNGVMPDLNARRYMNYLRVYELTAFAGSPEVRLLERAAALRECLKALWNEKEQWYDFIGSDGVRDTRYTVQLFKFLNSGVIGERERRGLISHLNEREFLSKYGLHSMSKQDIAYDRDDIDNGGGGICTHFTMQICGQLYSIGYDELANDILRRVYWWGSRMPYMGDSCAADMVMNREDTPLQGDISSVACAQMIFYAVFGISADFSGKIIVKPVKRPPAEHMKIENARLCGKRFAVEISGGSFTVTTEKGDVTAPLGESVTF